MSNEANNGITINEPGVWVCLPRHAVESIAYLRDNHPLEEFREDFGVMRHHGVRVELADGHTIDAPRVVVINP